MKKITDLSTASIISDESRMVLVNDVSKETTQQSICDLTKSSPHYLGISQSCNRGQRNAVLAELKEARHYCLHRLRWTKRYQLCGAKAVFNHTNY